MVASRSYTCLAAYLSETPAMHKWKWAVGKSQWKVCSTNWDVCNAELSVGWWLYGMERL